MRRSKTICLLILWTLVFQSSYVLAQKKTSKIELRHSNIIASDKNIRQGARRLIGNVSFWQDSTIMDCDSAYFIGEKNWFEAFGRVHVYKEGSKDVDVRSDNLKYNGNTKMAYFRNNVVLRDPRVVLYTDSLDYDIRRDIGYYLYNAQIVDSATTLTSKKGYYYNKDHTIYFKKKVEVNQNQGKYQMYTDTLKYDTDTKITYFFGPTEFYNDSNYMFAEFGWYNTEQNIAFFKKKAYYSNPNQTIVADSLFYDRDNEHGIAYSNVVVTDTAQQLIVKGNFVEVFKETEDFFVTDRALLMNVMDGDTMYLHADTLFANYDSTRTYRIFRAYHHTKIYKSNFQAKTDSLSFSLADSIIRFYGSPILWAEQNQITSSYIEGFVVNQKLDRFKLYDGGLVVSEQDSLHFNQIKGAEMIGYFKNNRLTKIDVFKRSETIYFPTDEFGIIGMNKSSSTDITLYLKKDKKTQKDHINRIVYRVDHDATMYPLKDVAPNDMKVSNFKWHNNWRPMIPTDVFIWEGNTPQLSKKALKKVKKQHSAEE